MRFRILALFACAFALAAPTSMAQPYPSKPVRMVLTNPPGGVVDILARVVSDELGRSLGQPFVPENRPGANGNIAAEMLLKLPADGYTLMVAPLGPFTTNKVLYANPTYDPLVDFAPISMLAVAPLILVVHPSVPAENLQALLAWMRKEGSVGYGSQGVASSGHLAMELLKSMTGVGGTHVPYKGGTAPMNDLMAGHIKVMFNNSSTSLPFVRRGAVRAIAVAEKTRLQSAPEIPTLDEQGVNGFEATPWFGMAARAGTPRAIVERLSSEISVFFRRPDIEKKFLDLGVELRGTTPDAFAAHIRSETEKWARIVKLSGATAD